MDGGGHQIIGPGKLVERPKKPDPPVRNVIPIIFIPGIGGSNLKVKENMEDVVRRRMGLSGSDPLPHPWRPPNIGIDTFKRIGEWAKYGPKERQSLLNTETTDVDNDGFLCPDRNGITQSSFTASGRRFRGFDSIHYFSYNEIINLLEVALNPQNDFNGHSIVKESYRMKYGNILTQLIEFKGDFKSRMERDGLTACRLDSSSVDRLLENQLPVYAFGYNWLKSNAISAILLYSHIKKIIQYYNDFESENGNKIYTSKKVILVTHSMGGLVARSLLNIETDEGIDPKNSLIMGIVHTVMPANGSPSAYRGMVSGVEWRVPPEELLLFPKLRNGATILMGRNSMETMPVMAHSPGCLQLLPNADYPKGWLVVEREAESRTDELLKLPIEDPYLEIYQTSKAWYRLIDQEQLDPAGIFKIDEGSAWNNYLKCLLMAKTFHENLKNGSNATKIPIFACYGDDKNFLSFGTIRWWLSNPSGPTNPSREKVRTASLKYSVPSSKGVIRGIGLNYNPACENRMYFDCEIQPQDTCGDGTVPWQSGRAPNIYILNGRVMAFRGLDHQSAMKNEVVQMFTLWAICKIHDGFS